MHHRSFVHALTAESAIEEGCACFPGPSPFAAQSHTHNTHTHAKPSAEALSEGIWIKQDQAGTKMLQ